VMARWVKRVYNEYPNFYLVAEASEVNVASVSYWNSGAVNKDGYESVINSVSDYPLYYAMLKAFGEQNEAYRMYKILAYDYLYGSPFNNKIFNGNHDVPRLFSELKGNKDKVKLSMAFLLTTRGIPQLYYGDELLFEGEKPDGILRKNFPGGWENDKINLFNANERSSDETEVHNYVRTILEWRKNTKEIHSGQLKHYKPSEKENVYVYFRYLEEESTMIIINNGDQQIVDFSLDHYKESLKGYSSGIEILSKINYKALKSIDLDANSAYIIKRNN
jgi:glycosidase